VATPQQLLHDLHAAGVEVSDVWDLVNTRRPYPVAIPVLMDWLEHLDERMDSAWEGEQLREGLVRALTVREARPTAAPLLVTQMRRYRGKGGSATAWPSGETRRGSRHCGTLPTTHEPGFGRRLAKLWSARRRERSRCRYPHFAQGGG